MAYQYQTGSATSQADLMNLLQTFAVAQGWTLNIYSSTDRWMAINNGSVYVQFRWDLSTSIAMFHSTGFTGTGTAPGNQSGDDGCGSLDASAPYDAAVSGGRRIGVIGNGPYTAYHFFADGTTNYIHVVLEYSPGLYRHFSFGTISKIGTWTGGQYAVGHILTGVSLGIPAAGTHSQLFGGGLTGSTTAEANLAGSVRVEGMANQSVGQQWMILTQQTASLGNDRAGNARIAGIGGVVTGNYWMQGMGFFRADLLNGFVPHIPIPIMWRDTTPAPDQHMLLGFAPDMWHVQMANLSPGQEYTIGGETFKVFPLVRKQTTSNSVEESRNCGIVYRKA